MIKKKPKLWFEESFDSLSKMDDMLHKMIKEMEGFEPRFRGGSDTRILVDLIDSGDLIVVRADLPGFSKDEIKLKVTDTNVNILASREDNKIFHEKNFYKQERSFGSVRRSVPLPVPVDSEKAKAKFENGVLIVKIPKKIKK